MLDKPSIERTKSTSYKSNVYKRKPAAFVHSQVSTLTKLAINHNILRRNRKLKKCIDSGWL